MCGAAAQSKQTQLVPDVEKFPGHIACDGDSKSEIVVPIVKDGKVGADSVDESCQFENSRRADDKCVQVVAIIDIDCAVEGGFDAEDQESLERLAALLSDACDW